MVTADGNRSAPIDADIVLRNLARQATSMSGADIERLVREARQAARRERRSLAWKDLDQRLSASRPQRPEALRWRMAVHESGHAIARTVLGLGVITLITIDAVDGGRVESEEPLPVEQTATWLTSLLVAKLAGRAAEEVFFGSCIAGSGSGPGSDLATATALALQMEVSLGYGAEMPLLYRDPAQHTSLLIYRADVTRNVNARLEDAFGRAYKLVARHSGAIRDLADALLVHNTLEGIELDTVLEDLKARIASVGEQEG